MSAAQCSQPTDSVHLTINKEEFKPMNQMDQELINCGQNQPKRQLTGSKTSKPIDPIPEFIPCFGQTFAFLTTCVNQIGVKDIQSKLVLCFQGSPLIVDKPLRLLVSRFCMKVNQQFRFGSLNIDPHRGQILLKMNPIIDDSIFEKDKNPPPGPHQVITIEHKIRTAKQNTENTAKSSLKHHQLRMLYQINLLLAKPLYSVLNDASQQQAFKQQFQMLSELKDLANISSSVISSKEHPIMQANAGCFQLPRQQPITGMNAKVFTYMKISSPYHDFEQQIQKPENFIGQGGFSKIYRVYLAYKISDCASESRYFVAKQIKKKANNDDQEVEIIKQLTQNDEQGCAFIAKYYIPIESDPRYDEVLFMEFYMYSSLDQFRMRQDPVLTLSTKFYLFYQLALGIKFLVDKQVQHNDLKPGNILVSKTNIIKIIDFGEATHPRLAIGNPGRTMPYTSPEAFDHNKSSPFNPRHDIFALGVIVYEMIFDQYPVDYRRSKIKLLEDKYKTKKIPFQTDQESFEQQGPKEFMKIVHDVVMKCLNQRPDDRPYIDWLVIFFRQSLAYLDKLY